MLSLGRNAARGGFAYFAYSSYFFLNNRERKKREKRNM
jgi:hypothetical protein